LGGEEKSGRRRRRRAWRGDEKSFLRPRKKNKQTGGTPANRSEAGGETPWREPPSQKSAAKGRSSGKVVRKKKRLEEIVERF